MIRVGTSGWSYDHWRVLFYPEKLTAKDRLRHYAEHFDTVEINSSFYRLPNEKTFQSWRQTVPREFTFAVKASRYLTHLKRLVEPREPFEVFMSRARLLGKKLGPVLFQLPPRFKARPDRLAGLLKLLPSKRRFAVEFRDPSWFSDETAAMLEGNGVALCIYDMVGVDCPHWVTAPFVYLRLHGTTGKYGGSYPPRELDRWAKEARHWLDEGLDVYVYFNNDASGHAVVNARELARRLEE
jgi:uncharacterized protein YecE (DUF72 family)